MAGNKVLAEALGSWRVTGDDKTKEMYGSSGSWNKGYVKLCYSKCSHHYKWNLTNLSHKPIRTIAAVVNSTVKLREFSQKSRLQISPPETSKNPSILVIPDQQFRLKAIEEQFVTAVKNMNASRNASSNNDERLTADEVIDGIVNFGKTDSDSDTENIMIREPKKKRAKPVSPILRRQQQDDMDWISDHDEWHSSVSAKTPSKSRVNATTPKQSRSEPRAKFYGSASTEPRFFSSSRLPNKTAPREDTSISALAKADRFSVFKPAGKRLFSGEKKYSKQLMPMPQSSLVSRSIVSSRPLEKGTSLNSSKSPLISHIDDDDDVVLYDKPLQGFSNLGNTCYMNAVLQSLLSLDLFSSDLEKIYKKYEANLEEKSLVRCLHELSICKRDKNMKQPDQTALLKRVSKAVADITDRYSDHRQHDAHEFMCEILDILKEETISLVKKYSRESTDSSNAGTAPNTSVVSNPSSDNFEFELVTKLECSTCGKVTTAKQTNNGLTVSIPDLLVKEPKLSIMSKLDCYIQDALDAYFEPEELEYKCERCGGDEALSSQRFSRLPRLLVVVAKRYGNGQLDSKVTQRLGVSRHITLSAHCDSDVPLAQAPNHTVKLLQIPSLAQSPKSEEPLQQVPQSKSSPPQSKSRSPPKTEATPSNHGRRKELPLSNKPHIAAGQEPVQHIAAGQEPVQHIAAGQEPD